MTAPKKRPSWLPFVLVGAVVVAGLAYGAGPGNWLGSDESQLVRGQDVRQGPLEITVVQSGNLEAKDARKLRSQLEGRTTILWLIPEGSLVKEGDLVAELDASEQEDRLVSQEIAVENATAQLTKAEQNLEIQISQNLSDIALASQNLEFAKTDEEKYLKGNWPQDLQAAEEAIVLAREELAQAADRRAWSRRLEGDGFLTRTELDQDELAHQRKNILLEQSQRKKTLLIDYEHPREKARLSSAVEEAERELIRVNLQAKAKLVDFQAEVNTSTSRKNLEQEKYVKLKTQIAAAKMIAPVAGMVVYGREEGGRMGGGDPIQEGTEVRERQEIITIPQTGGMVVEASLHESVLKKVQPGQKVRIRVDALPGSEFNGQVEFVALLADKGSWWANPNQRLYKTEIVLENPTIEMRPGMSCSIEILVDRIADATYVPVQAVFLHQGRTVAFVAKGSDMETRDVETGASTEKWVQILSGVVAGETVLMSPPKGFVVEAAGPNDETGTAEEGFAPDAAAMGAVPRQAGEDGAREGRGGRNGQVDPEGGAASGAGFPDGAMDPEKMHEAMRARGMTDEQIDQAIERFSNGGAGGARPRGEGGRARGEGSNGPGGPRPTPPGDGGKR
ncbi:MAG TPA: efflux RND transporter periplasmic adaptor subunit [Planctomycetota bacterium]